MDGSVQFNVRQRLRSVITEKRESANPYDAERKRLRDAFAAAGKTLPTEIESEVFKFRDLLGEESDRGCALLARARLESALGKLLAAFFVDDAKLFEQLTRGMGPLATFSSRINVCYMAGLISPAVFTDLHQFREIGNLFAHGPMDLAFDSQQVSDRCKLLRHDFLQELLPPRKKFMRVAMGVLGYIDSAIKQVRRSSAPPDYPVGDKARLEAANRVRKAIDGDNDT